MGKYFDTKIAKLVTYLAVFFAAIFMFNSANVSEVYADTPTLSFSASSTSNGGVVEMETLAPTSTSGAYTSGSDTLSITTTCSAGHSVYVSATSDNSYGTNLTNEDKTSSIPTGSFTLGSSGLGNIWGIRYDSGNDYIALPAYSSDISGDITPIYTGTNTTIPIYYGINVTPTLAPGEYSSKVLYTVLMASECEKEPEPEPTTQDTTTADYCTGSEYECMQDFQCYTLSSGATTTLIDKRDGNTYSVYRIPTDASADNVAGKCFMQSALRLGSTLGSSGSTGDKLIVGPASSNYDANASNSAYEEFSLGVGSIEINYVANTDASSWSLTDSYTNRQMTWGTGKYDFGYYSWGTAIVVCPKGWRLPTKNEYADNSSLSGTPTMGIAKIVGNSSSGSTALRNQSGVWKFPSYGGVFHSQGWANQSYGGAYWTSTQYDSAESWRLVYSNNAMRALQNSKYTGVPVRCIADDDFPADSMQGFNCSSLSAGQTATLTDARDGQAYNVYRIPTDLTYPNTTTIANIAGKCFMQSALRFGVDLVPSGSTGDKLKVNSKTSHYETASSTGNSSVSNSGEIEINYVKSSDYSSWNSTNTWNNRQFTYDSTNFDASYYSWGAAIVACPAGWRLPVRDEYGDNTGSGWISTQPTKGLALVVGGNNSTGSTVLRDQSGVWKFPSYGGGYWYGSGFTGFYHQDVYGYYWIATAINPSNTYTFGYNSSTIGHYTNSPSSCGRPIRCIAD